MYVLMVVPSNFPNGDAGAVRDMAFAHIYMCLGYKVFLISASRNEKEGEIEGVRFFSVYQEAHSSIDHLRRFLSSKAAYMAFIKRIIKQNGLPTLIHINDISHGAVEELRIIAKKNGIPILHDSTEWYSPCEFSRGKLDKQYILKDMLNRKIVRNPIKVIGISSYLTEHFKSRGLNAVRIPVIMDVKNTKIAVNEDEKVKLIYAGSPANKDYLKEIVRGVALLVEAKQKKLELHILGLSEEQTKDLTGLPSLPDCVRSYGRVPREKVEEVMLQMDFSVLLRPSEERYAKAGFPTKSVEAMSHGVAMLCNYSSDLDMYLTDMDNAVIVDDYTAEALARAIRKILTLTREQINEIKRKARRTAIDNFDYRLWIETVKNLIEE